MCNVATDPFIKPGAMYTSFQPSPASDLLPPCPLTAKRAFVPLTTRPGNLGRTIKILYDSGAQASLLSAADFNILRASRTPYTPVPDEGLTLTAANGSPIPYSQVIVVTLHTPSVPIRVPFFVCPTATTSILGMNAIARFRLYLDPVRLIADVQRTADVEVLDATSPGCSPSPYRVRARYAASISGREGISKCRMEIVDSNNNPVVGERTAVLDHHMTASVFNTDRNGRFTAPLSNLDHSTWNVQRHDVIGHADPLTAYSYISSAELQQRMELAPRPARQHTDAEKASIRTKLSTSLNKSAPPAYHRKALDLLMSFEDVFSASTDDIGYCPIMEHTIQLKDNHPIFRPQFQIPGEHLAAIKDQTLAWIRQGIVRRGRSPFNSPIFAVPKPHNRGLRIVLDFRGINDATLPDKYCIPSVDDTLHRIGDSGAKWFSSLDLSSGFYHIPLRDSDQHITAYTIPGLGQFVWRRAPMGLTGSPATFNRVIDTILCDVDNCLSYVDDILCFTTDIPSHLSTLARVLQRLRTAGLRVNPEKSVFLATEVDYLGAAVSAKGVRPTLDKTAAVAELQPPSSRKSLSAVLGFFNYMSRYIFHYAAKSAPLRRLAQKEANYSGGDIPEDALRAFNRIKTELSSRPLVGYISSGSPLHLYVDAALGDTRNSGEGFGAVLLQDVPGSIMQPVAYLSRALQPHERNYPAGLAELKAITWAIGKLSHHLRHRSFYLYSDHRPLTDKMLGACHRKTFAHCETFMEDFYPIWRHVRGPANVIADFLSRYHGIDMKPPPRGGQSLPTTQAEAAALSNCALVTHRAFNLLTTDRSLERLRWLQSVDPQLSDLMTEISTRVVGSSPANPIIVSSDNCPYPLTIWKGVLMVQPPHRATEFRDARRPLLIYTPESMRFELVNYAHGGHIAFSGHFGVRKTVQRIVEQHWWPSVVADCREIVGNCGVCKEATNKGMPPPTPRQPIDAPRRPNDRVQMDLQGPLVNRLNRNSYILVITDALTKHLTLRVIPDKEATTVAAEMYKFCMARGIPKQILTDNGPEFVNQVEHRMCQLLGIHRAKTSVYYPQTNGLAEEVNKTIQSYLRKCMSVVRKDDACNFKDYVLAIQFSYNTAVQTRTRVSPHDALYGYPARAPLWEDYSEVFNDTPTHDLSTPELVLRHKRHLLETRAIAHHNFALAQEIDRRRYNDKHNAQSPHYAPRQPVFVRCFVKAAVNPKFAPQWRRAFIISEFHLDVYIVFIPGGGRGRRGLTTKVNASHIKPAETTAGWLSRALYDRYRRAPPPAMAEADSQTEEATSPQNSLPGQHVTHDDVPRRPTPTPSLLPAAYDTPPDSRHPIFDTEQWDSPPRLPSSASPPSPPRSRSPLPGTSRRSVSPQRIPLPSSHTSTTPRSRSPLPGTSRHTVSPQRIPLPSSHTSTTPQERVPPPPSRTSYRSRSSPRRSSSPRLLPRPSSHSSAHSSTTPPVRALPPPSRPTGNSDRISRQPPPPTSPPSHNPSYRSRSSPRSAPASATSPPASSRSHRPSPSSSPTPGASLPSTTPPLPLHSPPSSHDATPQTSGNRQLPSDTHSHSSPRPSLTSSPPRRRSTVPASSSSPQVHLDRAAPRDHRSRRPRPSTDSPPSGPSDKRPRIARPAPPLRAASPPPALQPRRLTVRDPSAPGNPLASDPLEEPLLRPPSLGSMRLPQRHGLRPYDEACRTKLGQGRPRATPPTFPVGRRPRRPRSSSSASTPPAPQPRRLTVRDPSAHGRPPASDPLEEPLAGPPTLGSMRLPQRHGLRPYDEARRTKLGRGRPRKKRVRINAAAPVAIGVNKMTNEELQRYVGHLLTSELGRRTLESLICTGTLPLSFAPQASPAATKCNDAPDPSNPYRAAGHTSVSRERPEATALRMERASDRGRVVSRALDPGALTRSPRESAQLSPRSTVAPPSGPSPPSRHPSLDQIRRAGAPSDSPHHVSQSTSSPAATALSSASSSSGQATSAARHQPARGQPAQDRIAHERNSYFARRKSQSDHLISIFRTADRLQHLSRCAAARQQQQLRDLGRVLPHTPPQPRRRPFRSRLFRRLRRHL